MMASVCQRCALRLQRTAKHNGSVQPLRAFSNTPIASKSLPVFEESSIPELDSMLSTLRTKHLIPAYLTKHERRMTRAQKHQTYLTENPQTTRIGDEEVTLEWTGNAKVPNSSRLLERAANLMLRSNDPSEYRNFPPLFHGAHEGLAKNLSRDTRARVARKLVEAGQLSLLLQMLRRTRETGWSLKQAEVRRYVLVGLRERAVQEGWGQEAVEEAIKHATMVAAMLESDEHGSGRVVTEEDPRTQPEVLGAFLELAAVHAYKYQDGKDGSGAVKMYADRLLDTLQGRQVQVELKDSIQQVSMLTAIPVWHGLHLAVKIVGNELKNPEQAQGFAAEYEEVLMNCASELEARNPQPGSYDHQALSAWESCIRD